MEDMSWCLEYGYLGQVGIGATVRWTYCAIQTLPRSSRTVQSEVSFILTFSIEICAATSIDGLITSDVNGRRFLASI